MKTNIQKEKWMRNIEDKLYGDEVYDDWGQPVGHPHYMKCAKLNDISKGNWDEFWGLQQFTGSMLNPKTLTLINYFASISTGTILEIGAFTGGATISAGNGLSKRSKNESTMIAIEAGFSRGSEWSADTSAMPPRWQSHGVSSRDVFSILSNHVKAYNLEEKVNLFEGYSNDSNILEKIIPILEKDPIGLLIIDADGNLARDLNIYLQYVKKGGYLIFDDYVMVPQYRNQHDKATPTQAAVHSLVNYGVARSLGLYPHGTWFGQKL